MSAKDLITVGMIRRVNEKIISRGTSTPASSSVYSAFLDKTLHNPVNLNTKAINDAWKKVREQLSS